LQKYLDFLARAFGYTLHTTYKQQGSIPGPTARTVFDPATLFPSSQKIPINAKVGSGGGVYHSKKDTKQRIIHCLNEHYLSMAMEYSKITCMGQSSF